MKLKGDWDSGTTYSVGDVVLYTDGNAYHLLNECAAGTSPIETRYWNRTSDLLNTVVNMIMDMIKDIAAKIPTNIDDEGIILKSGDNEYLVSVDASGDTPEVVAELVESSDDVVV